MRRISALFEIITDYCAYVLPITDQCQDFGKLNTNYPVKTNWDSSIINGTVQN